VFLGWPFTHGFHELTPTRLLHAIACPEPCLVEVVVGVRAFTFGKRPGQPVDITLRRAGLSFRFRGGIDVTGRPSSPRQPRTVNFFSSTSNPVLRRTPGTVVAAAARGVGPSTPSLRRGGPRRRPRAWRWVPTRNVAPPM